jgi:cyanophycinase
VDAARRAADDEALAHQVAGAGGVFFVGGDQGRITAALRHADGTNTRILDAVWALYRRGGVVAGTSAGAAIMSSTMFYDAQEVLPTLQEGVHDGKDIAPGLGFIGTDVFIDQHLIVRGRFARMLPVMLARGYKLGLGVDENTAMVVDPGHTVHVLGATGAIVLDLAHARTRPGSFNIEDARIGYLDAGDACDLVTGAFLPAADKAPIDPAHPYYHGVQFAADILGPGSVLALMEKLVDSDQRSATGLAFGAPHSRHAALGFEFTLTRSAGTRAWLSNLTERYTVADLRLDVRPVRMHRPLYGQLPGR